MYSLLGRTTLLSLFLATSLGLPLGLASRSGAAVASTALSSMSATVASSTAALAETPASESDPKQFIMQYYEAKAKTKFPLEVHGFFSKRMVVKQLEFEKQRKEKPAEFAMMMELAQAFGGDEPSKIKVLGKDAALSDANREIFDIEAVEIPASYKKMMTPDARCSLKGLVGLVKENGEWKIDKDVWKFEMANKDGKMSQSSGLNPDKESSGSGSDMSGSADMGKSSTAAGGGGVMTELNGDSDDLIDRFMKLWSKGDTPERKAAKGKSIYVVCKLDGQGTVEELKVGGGKPQPVAEKALREFFTANQPFKPLPRKYDGQPNVWMMFDWANGGEAISGPYFSKDAVPDSILEKAENR